LNKIVEQLKKLEKNSQLTKAGHT